MAGLYTKRCRGCNKAIHRKYFDGTPTPQPGQLPICRSCWKEVKTETKAISKAEAEAEAKATAT